MRTLFIVLAILSLTACSTVTGFLYGPDATPSQIKDYVYQDAYAIGAIQAARKGVDKSALIAEAEDAKSLADPNAYFTKKFLEAIAAGESENALLYYSVRRLYQRVGAQLIEGRIDTSTLDVDLFVWACDAYIAGVKGEAT